MQIALSVKNKTGFIDGYLPKPSSSEISNFNAWMHNNKLLVTIKMLLAIVAAKSWNLVKLDVNNAFLNGDLKEEVFMEIPPGFKLQKDKYPKNVSLSDYSLVFKGSESTYVALLVYVDDVLIIGSSNTEINLLKQKLSAKFKLKDLGSLGYFLGLEVAKSKEGIFVSQRNYTLQLIEDLGFLAAKPVSTPMDPRNNLQSDNGDLFDDHARYRRSCGSIAILKYNTASHFFFSSEIISIHVFSKNSSLSSCMSSDWGKCLDSRRSITGFAYFLEIL
ncbi:uncharacterized mitochondrial protein AtMg00810-like [Lactuca sativa]|uniref:uncharacterized mitochondrial protein AtMg00810-like n=1 Tax=Lactuca sativa TaxID=4236 RepID=UPI000CD98F65|nr:uncharacterized mitochondrial protein AtMg00810-like [Lactuca sativa]